MYSNKFSFLKLDFDYDLTLKNSFSRRSHSEVFYKIVFLKLWSKSLKSTCERGYRPVTILIMKSLFHRYFSSILTIVAEHLPCKRASCRISISAKDLFTFHFCFPKKCDQDLFHRSVQIFVIQ